MSLQARRPIGFRVIRKCVISKMFSKFDKRSQGVQQNLSVKYVFVISGLAYTGLGYCLCSLVE